MARAMLSIVGLAVTVCLLVYLFFGWETPSVITVAPGMTQSAENTAKLEQRTAAIYARDPLAADTDTAHAPSGGGNAPADAPSLAPAPGAAPVPSPTPGPAPAQAPASDQPEVISPDSTAHLNPAHVANVDQPALAGAAPGAAGTGTFNPNPAGFVPPIPLPAHPQWTWDVGNREFNDVVVTHVDADLVTITSDSGPAQIDIAMLPADIQGALNYNPQMAAAAAAARKNQPAPVTANKL